MTTLYIIGNGFDLWHDLPTSYANFYDFAKELLDELENFYPFDASKTIPWHDFENFLGAFDWTVFYKEHNFIDVDSESFKPSLVYSLEDDLTEQADHLVTAIRDLFQEWVVEIDISGVERMLTLPTGARFITFNYTSMLEAVYGVDKNNVLHIHGRAETFDELVFGHGETQEEEPELDENGDSNRTIFSDSQGAAKYPFYALQKPVNKVLEEHKEFLESLMHTSEIIVIGHSLNKIDLPYFKKLVAQAPSAKWTVCVYRPEEETGCISALVQCGVQRELVRTCTYHGLVFAHGNHA
jgi:hypothetical protein